MRCLALLVVALPRANEAFLAIADEVTAPCLGQGLFYQVVVLGLAVLNECALQSLLVGRIGHVHWLHGARVYASEVHSGRHGGRRRIEVLHLLGHVA